MADLEAAVRNIDREGLLWGTSKLVSVGYGIKKLQINVAVEDDKVSTQHDPSCAHDSLVSDYGRR
ncbi:Elongation factor 1-delta 2 [Beauveria bassiana]|uniref:Elongation factor 1-delta 2 n=1 Tax=Beauveria bassiana TaxID=176275 RepID=A0A2N6NVG4_BEABA|nr:Elongation factor 1-delta 2 [Beauveria bassiana]